MSDVFTLTRRHSWSTLMLRCLSWAGSGWPAPSSRVVTWTSSPRGCVPRSGWGRGTPRSLLGSSPYLFSGCLALVPHPLSRLLRAVLDSRDGLLRRVLELARHLLPG